MRSISTVAKVLDTPVVDLLKKVLPAKPTKLDNNTDLATSTLPSLDVAKPTFSPIEVNLNETSIEQKVNIDTASQSFTKCFKSALGWAWRASPVYALTSLASASIIATLPYLASYTGAKITDNLVNLAKSQDINFFSSAISWFQASALIGIGLATAYLVSNYAKAKHNPLTEAKRKNDIRKAFSGFSPAEHLTPEIQQLTNRTLQAQWALQEFGNALSQCIVPAISTIGALGILLPYSPVGAGVIAIFSVPHLYHAYKRGQDELRTSEAYSDANMRFGNREWGLLSGPGSVDITLNNKSSELLNHLVIEQQKFLDRYNEPTFKELKRTPWVGMLNNIATASVAFVLITEVGLGIIYNNPNALSIGMYGMVAGALYTLSSSVQSLSSNLGSILKAMPLAKLAHAVIESGNNRTEIKKPEFEFKSAPEVLINDLKFSYPATGEEDPKQVLKGMNLKINSGELVVIVGESGSAGKSTLLNVLCGLYDPVDGEVLFDKQSTTEHDKKSLWEQSAYLRQKSTLLYAMTIRDNIALGSRRNLTDNQIIAMAKETGFYDIMEKEKLELNTVLGEWLKNGRQLSGGQVSRLLLTRQAATEAKFLVLDEPTANLDQIQTDLVLRRIRDLNDVTRLVVAHDIGIAATIADRVVVIDNGQVIDSGSHKDLLERCNIYKNLYNAQLNRLQEENKYVSMAES